ncbi:MAG: hypothetical protein IEMM0002_0061 [bacterium]|nr:MAG: hypothetical protein IEMM0002_0061 [bacterium]
MFGIIKKISTVFAAALSLLFLSTGSAFAAGGVPDPASADLPNAVTMDVDWTYNFIRAAHVANGVAMTNRTSGTIHLRGVPAGSAVYRAFLYYNFSDGNAVGAKRVPAIINGHRVSGQKVADNIDPCWGAAGNHTYRANVTAFVPKKKPNQDYVVAFTINKATTGENPWDLGNPQNHVKGATLIVVYRSAELAGSVTIYDALDGSEFNGLGTFNLVNPGVTAAGLFTMTGADGQRGQGHDNGAANETTFFNGTQIAGPPVVMSDWDGTDGIPMPQLWDTHTHPVKLAGGLENVVYNAPADCLVPVAFVIQD